MAVARVNGVLTRAGRGDVRPVVVVRGTVKVNAPLIGGRAEDLTVREISKLIARQQEFAASWLAGDRPAA